MTTITPLSETQKKEITRRVRQLAVKHLQMGVSTGTLIICRACGYARPLIGATCYGKYRLCNDCTLEYELDMASGEVRDIETFIALKMAQKHLSSI